MIRNQELLTVGLQYVAQLYDNHTAAVIDNSICRYWGLNGQPIDVQRKQNVLHEHKTLWLISNSVTTKKLFKTFVLTYVARVFRTHKFEIKKSISWIGTSYTQFTYKAYITSLGITLAPCTFNGLPIYHKQEQFIRP